MRDWQNISVLSELTDLSVVAIGGEGMDRPPKPVELWMTLDPEQGGTAALEREWWREDLGHPDDAWSPSRGAALRRLLESTPRFDFAVIEDVVFWRYADVIRQSIPVIIDYHNVQTRMEEDYLAFLDDSNPVERERAALALRTTQHIERQYRELPAVVCSEQEATALVERGFARERVAIVSNTVDVGDVADTRSPARPPRILFAGLMNYAPNAFAALTLVRDIFPRVRAATADAELWLVGRDPLPELFLAAQKTAGVYVTGYVPETRSYFQSASVLSVPLELGGGTRFKILEAFKYGLPVVTSPKGCEGLAVTAGDDLIIARSSDEHARALITVLDDPKVAARLSARAAELVRTCYSFATAARQWAECLRQFGWS